MKTMRTLVSCFAALLMAASSFAQSRPATQSTVAERYVAPIGLPRPVPNSVPKVVPTPQGALFTVTELDSNWQQVGYTMPQAYNVIVKNTSPDTETIYFSRTQQIPQGWISSVCWGVTCYPPATDSMPYVLPPDSTANLILDLTATCFDEPDSGSVWLRVGVVGSASDPVLLPFYGRYTPGNPPLIFVWNDTTFTRTFQGSGNWLLTNVLTNLATRSENYVLSMDASLPTGWTLQMCDTRPAFGGGTDTCASGTTLVTNFAPNDPTNADYRLHQQKIKFVLTVPSVSEQDSAVISLGVHPQTDNPADSANYRFVMTVMPSAGVGASSDERAGIAVTNAWPNPLVSEGTLHLEVLTDASGPAKAIIYDVTGTQKATVNLGTLQAGTNQLQLAAPSLSSGEYLLRIVQDGSASEVVKINLVK